jgi:hypothetical protein
MDVLDGMSVEGRRRWPEWVIPILNRTLRDSTIAMVPLRGDSSAPELVKEAANTCVVALRALVDQWLDSGGGSDASSGYSAWRRSIYWTSSRYPTSLEEILASQAGNLFRIVLMGNGRYAVARQVPQDDRSDPLQRARLYALNIFVALLESPARERLFRCEACNKYFVRERMPKKDSVTKHGVFCGACPHQASERRTNMTRYLRAGQMVSWAADDWEAWRPGRESRSRWVSKRLNARIDKRPSAWKNIKANWVTRNQKAIEAEVARRKYAKS